MVKNLTPNRAVVFAVLSFVAYWIAAMFVPAVMLRDIFNALAFGAAVIIAITWASSAYRAVRENADSGEWLLILAIFIVWFVVLCQRSYVIAFNWSGRPEVWSASAISGFWPYSYTLAGILFLAAPGVKGDGIEGRAIWAIIAAVAIGCLVAGILIGASISTV
jgi:hypothetical protein